VEIAALLLPSDPVEWDIELALRHPTIPEAPVAVVIYDHGAVEVVWRTLYLPPGRIQGGHRRPCLENYGYWGLYPLVI